jgi:hypothetical protein
VEVGQAVLALNLVDSESDLAESVVLILLQIGQGDLEYPALQCIVGVLETGGTVDEGLSDALKFVSIHGAMGDGDRGLRTLGWRMWWEP